MMIYKPSWLLIIFMALLACCWIPLRSHQNRHDAQRIQERYGEWAVVAGASEGLGAGWAETLCQHGLNVLLIARRETFLQALSDDLTNRYSCQVEIMVQDLAQENLELQFSQILRTHKIELLVYNAAYPAIGPFLQVPLEHQIQAVDINIKGVLVLTHWFTKYLQQQHSTGGVILMSSMAGLVGTGNIANYAATKSWNTAFAQGLAWELQPHSIDVLACVAGATATPNYNMNMRHTAKSNPTLMDRITTQTPRQVAQECLQALGVTPSTATGPINKLARILFTRILPIRFAIDQMSKATADRLDFSEPKP
jgi:short-subunit dehydrogenase